MKAKLFLFIVLAVVSYITIWRGHTQPNSLIWDEHFHIPSAQKYINSIYFQEPHPPLGKLLIALGEKIIGSDPVHKEFLDYDRAPNTPDDFNARGYRFFPTLFSCAIPIILFDTLLLLTVSLPIAFLIALLPALDLALPIHSRVAHLESFQIFFILAFLSSYLRLQKSDRKLLWSIVSGLFFGLATSVKVTSLVLLPLLALFPGTLTDPKRYTRPMIAVGAAFLVFFASFYIHYQLGSNVHPELKGDGFFSAPQEIRPQIQKGVSVAAFPLFFNEWLRFFDNYEKGVPKLNLCKTQENGSYPLLWPIGGGTISYSWKKDGDVTRYVTLLANPAVWAISFLGFLLGFCQIVNRLTTKSESSEKFGMSESLTILYICYYGAMLHVDRVMYLYHAFIPLIFGLIVFALRFEKLEFLLGYRFDKPFKLASCFLLLSASTFSYLYFRPLVSYQPITDDVFNSRKWFDIWNLRCANCPSENPIAKPFLNGEERIESKDYWKVEIDGVKSGRIEQEWGEPKTNQTVDSKPLSVGGKVYQTGIGTHARSKIEFRVPKDVSKFESFFGVDDQGTEIVGSVVFEVKVNGKAVFTSAVMRSGDQAQSLSVPVSGGDKLELFAYDAGDGNSYDHASWLEPHFLK